VNSDDPAYFGGYIEKNLREAATALDLSERQIRELARNAFTGAFIPSNQRYQYMRSLETYK
jgi:adenosine deaminase